MARSQWEQAAAAQRREAEAARKAEERAQREAARQAREQEKLRQQRHVEQQLGRAEREATSCRPTSIRPPASNASTRWCRPTRTTWRP